MFFWPGRDNGKYQAGHLTDWDDEYSEEHNDAIADDDVDYPSPRDRPTQDKSAEGGFNPMDIANPVSAYFFLSDGAQDEISGS